MKPKVLTLLLAALCAAAAMLPAAAAPLAGPCAPGAVYDPACDVDQDGDVDVLDIQLAAGHWNQAGTWTGGDYWSLTGNAGTTAGTHFLGTSDLEALELRVAGQRALRLEPIASPPDGVPTGGDASPNVIGGHSDNVVTTYVQGAAIGGGGSAGFGHQVYDDFGVIGGGQGNQAGDGLGTQRDRAYATVGGGLYNWAAGDAAVVAGGRENTAWATYATVGGGFLNQASSYSAAVAGGASNQAGAAYATVAGGSDNVASAGWATVGGGRSNTAGDGDYAMVGGGYDNQASGLFTAVAGGLNNAASGDSATVAGGVNNTASGDSATVAGGAANTASGDYATVAGGASNRAGANYSLAAGRRAKADHAGAFVWADSTDADFVSTADNQFLLRASGGVGVNTNAPNAALAVDGGNSVARIAVNSNSPTANAGLALRQDGVSRWSLATVSADGDLTFFREGAGGGSRLFIDGGGANAGYVGIGNSAPQYPLHMASGAYVTAGGVWTNASSRQLKTGFAPVDQVALLQALASLPIETWSYRAEGSGVRHLGPVAEDFYAAFGLGSNEAAAIGTVDADGVALATIQALYQIILEQQAQLATQQQRIEVLNARLAALEHQRSE
jgi:hypothetical protein